MIRFASVPSPGVLAEVANHFEMSRDDLVDLLFG
jgi:hypothetical protein